MKKILDRKRNEPLENKVQKEPREDGKDPDKCPMCGSQLVNLEEKKICTHRNCVYTETE